MSGKPSVWTIALAGGIIALAFGVISVVVTLNKDARFRSQALRSTAVIRTIDQIELSAVMAEASQRGFLINGNGAYLAPFEIAVSELYGSIAEYEHLIAGIATPSQIEDTQRLKEAADFKVDELRDVVTLYQSGDQDGALDLFRSGKGVRAMNGIRDIVVLLEAEEEKLLESTRQSGTAAREQMEITLAVLALLSLSGFGLAYLNHVRSDRLTVVEEHAVELAEAREQADLLARELNHRVKNLFAIVQSIISATGRQESDPVVAASKARQRIHALSQAHALTSTLDAQTTTTLGQLLESIVRPQMTEPQSLVAEGPVVKVPAQLVTPLGMILHELTTNAIKYGAWSDEAGAIAAKWTVEREGEKQMLVLEWTESCDPSRKIEPPDSKGFGSRMMSMSLVQLGGTQQQTWEPGGLRLLISLPTDGEMTVVGRN